MHRPTAARVRCDVATSSAGDIDRPSAVFHLGPTNSGKTHDAVQFLLERARRDGDGRCVFAAPLRMLAWEAYDALVDALGVESVGLITGEERVNDSARVLCTTAEMAPADGDVLVLDEVHWAVDRDRGSAWTRLLAESSYDHYRLLGAPDALPLLRRAFPDGVVQLHERLGELRWIGDVHVRRLQPQTAVVAFSRKVVLYLAQQLIHQYGARRVAVLYGAMPPAARRTQIDRIRSGEADLLVCTDVIGHGVNLPLHRVLFAESSKYDGEQRRALERWEIAQIAGRAGRFGHHDHGEVGVLTGDRFLQAQGREIRKGLTPHIEIQRDVWGYRELRFARVRPQLVELDARTATELASSLRAWETATRARLADHPWLQMEPIEPMLDRLGAIRAEMRGTMNTLSVADAWQLARCPVDTDMPGGTMLLVRFARAAAGLQPALEDLVALPRHVTLAQAEAVAARAAALRWFTGAFEGRCTMTADDAAAAEQHAAERVSRLLAEQLAQQSLGRCNSCDARIAPWFTFCDDCHHGRSM